MYNPSPIVCMHQTRKLQFTDNLSPWITIEVESKMIGITLEANENVIYHVYGWE